MSRDITSLGEFNLDGLAPAPRGVPRVEVTFEIDASGILSVAAEDVATGRAEARPEAGEEVCVSTGGARHLLFHGVRREDQRRPGERPPRHARSRAARPRSCLRRDRGLHAFRVVTGVNVEKSRST